MITNKALIGYDFLGIVRELGKIDQCTPNEGQEFYRKPASTEIRMATGQTRLYQMTLFFKAYISFLRMATDQNSRGVHI